MAGSICQVARLSQIQSRQVVGGRYPETIARHVDRPLMARRRRAVQGLGNLAALSRLAPPVHGGNCQRLVQRDDQIREYMNFRRRCRSTSSPCRPSVFRCCRCLWFWLTMDGGSFKSTSPPIRRPNGPRHNYAGHFRLTKCLNICFVAGTEYLEPSSASKLQNRGRKGSSVRAAIAMAASLRGARQRHHSPRMPGSRNRFQRGFSIPAHEVFLAYYRTSRTHLSLAKDAPEPRPMQPLEAGAVVAIPQVGGLHTAMSGAPPERSDSISIHGRVPILAARHDQTSFLVANRRHGFLVLLVASGEPWPEQMIRIFLLRPVRPWRGFTTPCTVNSVTIGQPRAFLRLCQG
jgi:hypothetical protein